MSLLYGIGGDAEGAHIQRTLHAHRRHALQQRAGIAFHFLQQDTGFGCCISFHEGKSPLGIVVIGTVPRHNLPVITSVHVSARIAAVVEGEVVRASGDLLNAKGILFRTTLELLILFCADGQHVQIFAGGVLQVVFACGTGFLYAPQERIVVLSRGFGQGICVSHFVGGRLAACLGVKIHVGLVATLAADDIFAARLQGYGGVFVSQQGIIAVLECGICRQVLGYIAIVVDFLCLGIFVGKGCEVGIV